MSQNTYPTWPGATPLVPCRPSFERAVREGYFRGCLRCWCLRHCWEQHVPWPTIKRAGCTGCGLPRADWRGYPARPLRRKVTQETVDYVLRQGSGWD